MNTDHSLAGNGLFPPTLSAAEHCFIKFCVSSAVAMPMAMELQ
jgi:hypothetical protein